MKKVLLFLILLLPSIVRASEITSSCHINLDDKVYQALTDDDFTTYASFAKDETINIECSSNVSYIYISYDKTPVSGTITGLEKYDLQGNYLHELVKLNNEKQITLTYDTDFILTDLYLFDEELPDWVQDWQTLEKADLMLFSTHADDEQLFFAGLLPTYVDRGKKIEVIYYTNHYDNIRRYHELLNGLWTLGIKYYPEMSTFPDKYSETLEDALNDLKENGYTEEDAIAFQVDMIRKYKPLIVVGHDEEGEYSHGQHILNTYTLEQAIYKAADKEYKTSHNYEPFQIDKLYLHLYKENPLIMDYDQPLNTFGGKTAFEVAKEGYAKHLSQQYTWFTAWLVGEDNEYTKMTDITEYSPCEFGLYYSNVGADQNKNDMFENIPERQAEPKEEPIKQDNKEKDNNITWQLVLGTIMIMFSMTGLLIIMIYLKRR